MISADMGGDTVLVFSGWLIGWCTNYYEESLVMQSVFYVLKKPSQEELAQLLDDSVGFLS